MEQEKSKELDAAAELFKVLGSPIRLAILQRLAEQPATVTDLVEHLDVSQPLVSQHLRVLRSQQLVAVVVSGQFHTYEVVDHHVSHIVGDAIEHAKESL